MQGSQTLGKTKKPKTMGQRLSAGNIEVKERYIDFITYFMFISLGLNVISIIKNYRLVIYLEKIRRMQRNHLKNPLKKNRLGIEARHSVMLQVPIPIYKYGIRKYPLSMKFDPKIFFLHREQCETRTATSATSGRRQV